jgi:hypothetical protein
MIASCAGSCAGCSDAPVAPTAEQPEAPKPVLHASNPGALAGLDLRDGHNSIFDRPPVLPATKVVVTKIRPRILHRYVAQEDSQEEVEQPIVGISDDQFHNVVSNWHGIKSCLASSGVQAPGRGALKIAFTISGDGSVSEARITETSNTAHTEKISTCVEKSARGIKFPPLAGIPILKKDAKFVF